MKIKACMKCGSTNLRMPSVRNGRIPGKTGLLDEYVCDDCGHLGTPIIFDSAQAYQEFKKTRHKV